MNAPRQPLGRAFSAAFKGIGFALRHERNMRIHLLATLMVYTAGLLLHLQREDYLWLTLAISLVWITELCNTAIEQLTNLVHPEWHPVAGRVKDLAAGAVLIASIAGVIIAIWVFYPYLNF
jgi:diacylglycerol kinase